jgi:hypothetical protein
MKTDWIKITIELGGVMTVSENKKGVRAKVNWGNRESIYGEYCSTIIDAVTSLNSELEDDAVNEMIESGAV